MPYQMLSAVSATPMVPAVRGMLMALDRPLGSVGRRT